MKKPVLDKGTFAIGSLMFAVALACLITTAMPVIRLDWLGFAGSVIGAMMTLAAAVIAWRAVQRQIVESRTDAERKREQEEFAARAMMPFALSALIAYAEACVTQLNQLPNPLSHIPNIASPDLPTEHLESMRECLRYVGGDTAKQLFDIFAFLQIQNVRHREII